MNRLLLGLIALAPMLLWRKFSAATHPADPSASASGPPDARTKIVGAIAERFVDAHIDERALGLLTASALVYSVILAVVCAAVLGERGFGRGLGSAICFAGAAGSIGAIALIAPKTATPGGLVLAGALGSAALMALCAFLKAMLIARLDDFASGAATAPGFGASRSAPRIDAATAHRRSRA